MRTWSSTQSTVALPNGEAELYANNTAAGHALGLQRIMEDSEMRFEVKLITNSTAAEAMISRTGLGKMRHNPAAPSYGRDGSQPVAGLVDGASHNFPA